MRLKWKFIATGLKPKHFLYRIKALLGFRSPNSQSARSEYVSEDFYLLILAATNWIKNDVTFSSSIHFVEKVKRNKHMFHLVVDESPIQPTKRHRPIFILFIELKIQCSTHPITMALRFAWIYAKLYDQCSLVCGNFISLNACTYFMGTWNVHRVTYFSSRLPTRCSDQLHSF